MAYNADERDLPLLSTRRPIHKNSQKTSHVRDLHILSVIVFLILMAYHGAQNLESSLDLAEGLGTTAMGVHYVSFTLCSFVATAFVRRFGSWTSIVLGTTGYWSFIASNLFPSWCTMVSAALYMGFTNAIFWVGEATFLTFAARSYAIECNQNEANALGHFNGEFWGAFASTQVVGNLLSLALLQPEKEGEGSSTKLLFAVYLGSMTIGMILSFFLSKQCDSEAGSVILPSAVPDSSVTKLLKSTFNPLLDSKMLLLIPLLVYSGLEQAFVWAEFTKCVVKPAIGVQGVGGAMAAFGASGAIFSLLSGRWTNRLLSITSATCASMFCQVIVLIRLWLNHSFQSEVIDIINILIVAALWGIGDGVLNTQINAILALLFPDDTEAIFSQLKIWQSGSIAVVFFMNPHISFVAMMMVLLVTLSLACCGFLIVTQLMGGSIPNSTLY